MKTLGYKKSPPKLLDLHKDFLDVSKYGLSTAFGTLSVALAPSGEDSDMSSFMKDDEASLNFMRKIYTNPSYVSAMDELVPYFEMKGILQG